MTPLTVVDQVRARELLAPAGVPLPTLRRLEVDRDGARIWLRDRPADADPTAVSADAVRELLANPPATVQGLLFDLDTTGVIA